MTISSITPAEGRRANVPSLAPFVLTVGAITIAMAWQYSAGTHPDITWLTLMAERLLDGDRLYIDTQENNPPASIYLYVPAVVFARGTGISPELSVQLLALLLALAMFAAFWRMLTVSGYADEFDGRWLFSGACAIFILMPASTFAQREYIAAVLALAYLGIAAIRAAGKAPATWMIGLAGIAAGVMTAIKPPLASVAILASALVAMHRRSLTCLFSVENWIGAAIFAAYVGAIVWFHPAFFSEVTPLLKDVYLRDWFPVIALVLPTFYLFVVLLVHAFLQHRSDWFTFPVNLVFATAIAFLLSYALQMKFFDYHAFPVSAFAMLGICMAICRKGAFAQDDRRWISATSLAVLIVCGALNLHYYYGKHHGGKLAAAIADVQKGARVAGFSTHIGQFLREVRLAGGTWVSSLAQTYVPKYAHAFRAMGIVDPQWDARLLHWEKWTADIFQRDLALRKPHVVLMTLEQDYRWNDWAKGFPGLAAELQNYRFVRKVDLGKGNHPIAIYVRKRPGD